MLLPIVVDQGYKKYCCLIGRELYRHNSWYVFKKIILLEEHLTLSFISFGWLKKDIGLL